MNKALIVSAVACAVWAGAPAFAAPSNFVSFDAPNSLATQTQCINPAGSVVGYYFDQNFATHGFLRTATGTTTAIDDPNAAYATYALGINASGTIVGIYFDSNDNAQGFLRSAGGAFLNVEVPNAIQTFATSMNDAGAVLGAFQDSNYVYHGFIRAASGTITTFDAPGAGTGPYQGTMTTFILNQFGAGCSGLSNSGAATGSYVDSSDNINGFVRSATGTSQPLMSRMPHLERRQL